MSGIGVSPAWAAEQRAKWPPNCPRCVVTRTWGLVRCLSCAIESLARSERERRGS